ncbi:ornithine cyclodeaminase family protein [Pelomyxa schiedti]|nr:ornithine cyclodeaminase family protein [Pelomyxa schiedti]
MCDGGRNVRFLSKEDQLRTGLTPKDVIAAVEHGFRLKSVGKVEMPPKLGLHPRPECFSHAMPCYVGGEIDVSCTKWISVYSGGPSSVISGSHSTDSSSSSSSSSSSRESSQPAQPASLSPPTCCRTSGVIILNDAATGIPVSIMDCGHITTLRTGAAAAVAAKYLASESSSTIAVLGCGKIALSSVASLVETFPHFDYLRCYDTNPEALCSFTAQINKQFPHVTVQNCTNATELLSPQTTTPLTRPTDILITATPMTQNPAPTFTNVHSQPGLTAIALDYDASFDESYTVNCDTVVTDDFTQFQSARGKGPYFSAFKANALCDRAVDLAHIVSGGHCSSGNKCHLAFLLGIAMEDAVTAKLVYDRACSMNIGTQLHL